MSKANFLKRLSLSIVALFATFILHAETQPKFALVPTTSPTMQIQATELRTIDYLVTNQTKVMRTLTILPIAGISQLTDRGGCANPFTLAPGQSCLLSLQLNGSQLPARVTHGPEICKTNGPGNNSPTPFLCSQPSAINSLNISVLTLTTIIVTPANTTIADGTTQQFTATGIYSDGSMQNLTNDVTWSSSNNNAATILDSGTKGFATAVDPGFTTIIATLGSVSGSTGLTVTVASLSSIAVTPANTTIADETTQQFTATGTYSDGSTQVLTNTVTWNSSNTSVATISNNPGSKGLATAAPNNSGSTNITAILGSTTSNTAILTVRLPQVVTLGVATGGNNNFPFNTTNQRYQVSYGASEINIPAGASLTRIEVRMTSTPAGTTTYSNFSIRVAYTPFVPSALTSSFAGNIIGGQAALVTVLGPGVLSPQVVIIGGNSYARFNFTTPFAYNGTSNLLLDFLNSGTSLNGFAIPTPVSPPVVRSRVFGTAANATGTSSTSGGNWQIRLTFS